MHLQDRQGIDSCEQARQRAGEGEVTLFPHRCLDLHVDMMDMLVTVIRWLNVFISYMGYVAWFSVDTT